MTFGEKLVRLRKEKNLSQEALAEQVNTTRQAVSKWENGQGYPDTEKLLIISRLFQVSVDSLLKDNPEVYEANENGYYVSRECAEGYLAFERRVTRKIAMGISILIGAGIPYFAPKYNPAGIQNSYLFAALILISGIGVLVPVIFMGHPYTRVTGEELLLDNTFYIELKSQYERQKKKFVPIIIFGIILFVAGIFLYKQFNQNYGLIFPYRELCCVLFAAALYVMIFAIGVLDSYDTLLNSAERMNQFHVRVWKKLKDKIVK